MTWYRRRIRGRGGTIILTTASGSWSGDRCRPRGRRLNLVVHYRDIRIFRRYSMDWTSLRRKSIRRRGERMGPERRRGADRRWGTRRARSSPTRSSPRSGGKRTTRAIDERTNVARGGRPGRYFDPSKMRTSDRGTGTGRTRSTWRTRRRLPRFASSRTRASRS